MGYSLLEVWLREKKNLSTDPNNRKINRIPSYASVCSVFSYNSYLQTKWHSKTFCGLPLPAVIILEDRTACKAPSAVVSKPF